MPASIGVPTGDPDREALDSLGGYIYQVYQSALAWIELKDDEFLYLEVAEDFAIAAQNALLAVQVKKTSKRVTINSEEIITSIDSFIDLQEKNPSLNVSLHHLTTSIIGKEKKPEHRIGGLPTLEAWRYLAKAGDLSEFRDVLMKSKLSDSSKVHIASLNDEDLRAKFLKKVHFVCGTINSYFLERIVKSKVSKLVSEKGGVYSQAMSCTAEILLAILKLSINCNKNERVLDRAQIDYYVEKATQVTLNRAQFEQNNRLIEKVLASSLSDNKAFLRSSQAKIRIVTEIPLPKALAARSDIVKKLLHNIEQNGVCWITGGAGTGKTITARLLADEAGGVWASINLRGQSQEQTAVTLAEVSGELSNCDISGLIVDDLDCSQGTSSQSDLCGLLYSASRLDILLIVTSSYGPTSDFLFASDLGEDITFTLNEFTESDIAEILRSGGVNSYAWAKYIYLVSGGGHPQLATAFIQSMASAGWDAKEIRSFNSLIVGSSAVDEVRKRTRERLLGDLPSSARCLIERLSLVVGSFGRELVLELGRLAAPIKDVGIIFDGLIGSWIDQHELDRYRLSPLLSNYASATLTESERALVQFKIADLLTKRNELSVGDMNSALLAAFSSKNKTAIFKISWAVLSSTPEVLEKLPAYLLMITEFRADIIAYPYDAVTNLMFRGAQLLLINQDGSSKAKVEEVLNRFSKEIIEIDDQGMQEKIMLFVYIKLLCQVSKVGLGMRYLDIISDVNQILRSESSGLSVGEKKAVLDLKSNDYTIISALFSYQTQQLKKIEYLLSVFKFLDECSPLFRTELLLPLSRSSTQADLFISCAWLSEIDTNTLDPDKHVTILLQLENSAAAWGCNNLAISCCKYRAVTMDEYANNQECALEILEDGFMKYGLANSELLRAKAKIMFRLGDHGSNLRISKMLLDSDSLASDIDKAYLCRDAGVSAEHQSDYKLAQHYYTCGSHSAKGIEMPGMAAMYVGLLADAALASWHDNNKYEFLMKFVIVLKELNKLNPNESLRIWHCHVVTRHILLWVSQDAANEDKRINEEEETKILPGCVSNPEPHKTIREKYIVPIDLAWYMLAKIECYSSLDVGITKGLHRYLPNGMVLEGQVLLANAKLHRGFSNLELGYLVSGIKETIASLAFIKLGKNSANHLDYKNLTYSRLPEATNKQQEQHRELSENFLLFYFSMCILKSDIVSYEKALDSSNYSGGFEFRVNFLDLLQSKASTNDYSERFAQTVMLMYRNLKESKSPKPIQIFDFVFKSLQIAQSTGNVVLFCETLLPWLSAKWYYMHKNQRFLLKSPAIYEHAVLAALRQENVVPQAKVFDVLVAFMPMLEIRNQLDLKKKLLSLKAS